MKLNANGNSTAALRLADFLPYRLSVLANTISNTLARSYADRFGVSIPQWRVMAVLGDDPGRSANELVERTRMDKVSVSRAVSALAADGRVLRRSDPTDRRRSLLRLSASGRSIYEKIVPLARRYEKELLGRLEPAERRALNALIEHLDEAALGLAEREPTT
ncbi:MAG: MarR family transcriptional regulator [Deltaproteobacteria bacterium]|nr:MarR family transcriptional regulator [Deltaproteobacteria bacterium]